MSELTRETMPTSWKTGKAAEPPHFKYIPMMRMLMIWSNIDKLLLLLFKF